MPRIDLAPHPVLYLLFLFLYAFSLTTVTASLLYDIFQLVLLVSPSLSASAGKAERSAKNWLTAGSDAEVSTCLVIWDTFRGIVKFFILSNALSDIRYLAIFLFLYLLCLLATIRDGPDELRWHLYSGETFTERTDYSKAFTRQMLALKTILEWLTFISGALVAGEYLYNNPAPLSMFTMNYGSLREPED